MLHRPKYGNRKVTHEGIVFDSKKELSRYLYLQDLQSRGEISGLQRQVKFILIPSIKELSEVQLKTKIKFVERTIQLAITYTADFTYWKGDQYVVEDVKASPKATALDNVFLLKEKIFRWVYGYPIKRVYKPNEEL